MGQAVRNGQEAGEIAKRGGIGGGHENGVPGTVAGVRRSRSDELASSGSYFGHGEERSDAYSLTDGVTDEHFESALTEARAEGLYAR